MADTVAKCLENKCGIENTEIRGKCEIIVKQFRGQKQKKRQKKTKKNKNAVKKTSSL